jgi:hypothetical protein
MAPLDLRFRQIHLDFHTSEQIPDVGAAFDPEAFATTLARARVNSITCFARCHHGLIYYDTRLNPERRHPHLQRNLLKEQIDACHARGIRVPIYTTVQWDHFTAMRHPEWLVVDENGTPSGVGPFEPGFYRFLCVNTPYVDFLRAHVREILETLPTDGLFLDIVAPIACCCWHCQRQMEAAELDPADPGARAHFGLQTINAFKMKMSRFIREINPDCSIFYNIGHVGVRHRAVADAYSHFELESLPSGGWGYLHFPVSARYARKLGRDILGMTGKFHTFWGDFHSYKNPAALEFECFRMLALGAKCSIGDQLYPSGALDSPTYDLVGRVYAEVERKEPWCADAQSVAEIGVLTPEEFAGASAMDLPPAINGITRMLDESAQQFDILDSASDFSRYRVLVLPDAIPVSSELAVKLDTYLAQGGSLIATFESGLNPEKTGFGLAALGVTLRSDGERDREGQLVRGRNYPRGDYVDYLRPRATISAGLPLVDHVMYRRGLDVEASDGSEILADRVLPYFDRDYRHFCSHRQTPSSGEIGGPGVVRNGRTIYFAHPLFTQYDQNAPRWCKKLFLNALQMFLPDPLVQHNGPSSLLATLTEQSIENRWILHLLHYIPERRGRDFDVIEDAIPLHDLTLSIRIPRPAVSAVAVPGNQPLAITQRGNRIEFTLDRLVGHQMVAISLG